MSIHHHIPIEKIVKIDQLLKEIYCFIEELEQQVKENVSCSNQDVEVDDTSITEGQTINY